MFQEKDSVQKLHIKSVNGKSMMIERFRDIFKTAVCKDTTLGVKMLLIGIEGAVTNKQLKKIEKALIQIVEKVLFLW